GRDLLGRHPVGAQRSVGGGAFDRADLRPGAVARYPAPGGAAHGAAADEPHHRHYKEYRAWYRDRRARNPQPGDDSGKLLLQRHPAHDGGNCVSSSVRASRDRRALYRDTVCLETRLMNAIVRQFFNIDIMVQAAPLIFRGLGMTLLVCAAVVPLGLAGGLTVALAGRARSRGVRFIVGLAVDVFRAVPPLVLLIFVHAGLPFAGLRLSPFASVCVAFFLNNSAYYGEIYRAGLDSVGAGQPEAARSTGLTAWQAMAYVVIPQAVRNVLPDLVSNTVEVIKLTSLASVVALPEMLYSADMARSLTYNSSPIVLAALVYLVLL